LPIQPTQKHKYKTKHHQYTKNTKQTKDDDDDDNNNNNKNNIREQAF
jgi:hypothetical protein